MRRQFPQLPRRAHKICYGGRFFFVCLPVGLISSLDASMDAFNVFHVLVRKLLSHDATASKAMLVDSVFCRGFDCTNKLLFFYQYQVEREIGLPLSFRLTHVRIQGVSFVLLCIVLTVPVLRTVQCGNYSIRYTLDMHNARRKAVSSLEVRVAARRR